MNRRSFLRQSVLVSSSLLLPKFLKASEMNLNLGNKKLIVIQLNGGNDGLNTVVPHNNDIYYQLRQSIALKGEEILKLDHETALHSSLKGLQNLYNNGELSIIQNVGYPNPDRSHFVSSDIWHSASRDSSSMQTGWIGRYLDSQCKPCQPYQCIELDDTIRLAVRGEKYSAFALGKSNTLKKINENKFLHALHENHNDHSHDEVEYLFKILAETKQTSTYLLDKMNANTNSLENTYPQHEFGNDLKTLATLINAGSETSIYYASLGGFDTHVFQKGQQARKLEIYDQAVSALVQDLKKSNQWKNTLIFTFSEFGRRVEQNASNGTDHGTANCCFLMGGTLRKPGLFNSPPDLQNLEDGDMKYEIDFRHIYADILESWLDTTQSKVLFNNFEKIGVV